MSRLIMEPTSPDLAKELARLGLSDYATELCPFGHPEIGLIPNAEASLTPGCSKLGGTPDLPPDFEWPTHRWPLQDVETWPEYAQKELREARTKGQVFDEGGDLVMPIGYLCQIDLEAVHRCDVDQKLPSTGLLVFFASQTTNIEDPLFAKRVASAVRLVNADRACLIATPPPPTPDFTMTGTCSLNAERRVAWDIPYKMWDEWSASLPRRRIKALRCDAEAEVHALLAAPQQECAGMMPPSGEVALLRLFQQDDLEFYIGDASWITFAIPEADLQARSFEAARASVFIG